MLFDDTGREQVLLSLLVAAVVIGIALVRERRRARLDDVDLNVELDA